MYRRRMAFCPALLGLTDTCSRCGATMHSNGELYYDEGPGIWSVAFECPEDGETYPIWTQELQAVMDPIVAGVKIEDLPLMGSGQPPLELPCPTGQS